MILGGIFGILSVATSFLILANHLKNTLIYDFGFSRLLSFSIAVFSPLILFFLGLREFILIIAIVGTVVGLIEGTTIVMIFRKARKVKEREPEYSLKTSNFLLYFIPAILILGAISQIIYYFI